MKISLTPPHCSEKLDEYIPSTAEPNLQELFSHDLNRSINPVIHADDKNADLQLELREYVITKEVELQLGDFLELYNNYDSAYGNGIWISGFFGSGKSHLLKMLALVLENRKFDDGHSALELFLENNENVNAELKAQLEYAIRTYPCENILFNIDVKTSRPGDKSSDDAVLGAFMRVLNEHRGFAPNIQYLAAFESDLYDEGKYEPFKEAYFNKYGKKWDLDKSKITLIESRVSNILAEIFGDSPEQHYKTLEKYKENYSLTPEDFAQKVLNYINTKRAEKGKNFRLNFMVDEVGQYVAGKTQLMLNLQTISEQITAVCGESSWLFVTAQEEIKSVIGQDLQSKHGFDFSKIQDRFHTHIKLSSQNVEEVISKRLLEKTERAKLDLSTIYAEKKDNFKTLFDFTSGSYQFRNFLDEGDFISVYPFIPYQFGLFQECIQDLSASGAFEGNYRSTGERSMLNVFHIALQKLENEHLGCIAPFDLMYVGIAKNLKTATKSSLEKAERDLPDICGEHTKLVETAIRLLKILLLVRYSKDFKSTIENLTVLMQTSFDDDLRELKRNISEALELLVRQSYVTQDGLLYLYLTDEQKALEERINNVEIESSTANEALSDMLFADVLDLSSSKIRDPQYSVDYFFTRMVNGEKASRSGKNYELGIDIFIPGMFDESYTADDLGNKYQSERQLVVVLAEDSSLESDVIRFLKTETYIKLSQDEPNSLIQTKQEQNKHLKEKIVATLQNCIAKASFYVGGVRIAGSGKNAKTLVVEAFTKLIDQVYNKRVLTKGLNCTEADLRQYMSESGMFTQSDAAIKEIMIFVNRSLQNSRLCTVESIVNEFQKIPYGWKYENILCLLASLFPTGQIEFESAGRVRVSDLRELELKLKNTREQKSLQIVPVKVIDPQLLRQIRDFAKEYFSGESFPADAEQLRRNVVQSFLTRAQAVKTWLSDASREAWPISSADKTAIQQIIDVATRLEKDDRVVFEELPSKIESLKSDWTSSLSQLSSFINNARSRELFSSSKKLLEDLGGRHVDDLLEGAKSELLDKIHALQKALLDQTFYEGAKIRGLYVVKEDLRNTVLAENNKLKEQAYSRFTALNGELTGGKEYAQLDEAGKAHITSFFTQKEESIKRVDTDQSESYLKLLKLTNKFDEDVYNAAYELLAQEEISKVAQTPSANTTKTLVSTGEIVPVAPKPQIKFCKLGELLEESFGPTIPPLSSHQDVETFVEKLRVTLDEAVSHNVKVLLK